MKGKQKTKAGGKLKHNFKRQARRQKGITLIALIITIVILIILATITINLAFGDNGLIKRAQQARDLYANESASELDVLNEVDEYLKEKIEKVIEPDTPVEPEIPYTNVYVTLYEGGTLGFSNDESKIGDLTPIADKTWNITDSTFSAEWSNGEYTATTPWFGDRESVTRVVFVNEIVPKSVTALLMGCTNLTTIEGIENLNTTNVSSFAAMFDDCKSLTSIDVSNLKTNNVTNMFSMFSGDSGPMALTEIIGLEQLDTSKVTDMGYLFSWCNELTSVDVSGFDTSNVTDMCCMFEDCTNLEIIDVSSFNTEKVTDMSFMFGNWDDLAPRALTEIIGLEEFNTSNVQYMDAMFKDCVNFTSIDVSNFDTSNVISMSYMFSSSNSNTMKLTEIKGLENFNTENVENMAYLFWNCTELETIDVSNFNTRNVIYMSGPFGSYNFEMNLTEIKGLTNPDFDTSNVQYMDAMFKNCVKLTNVDVSNFNTEKVLWMDDMFYNCKALTSLDLSNFNTSNVEKMNKMFANCSSLTEILVGPNWTDANASKTDMFTGCKISEVTQKTV